MKHRTHPQPLGKPGAGLVGRMSLPFLHRSADPFQPADRIGFCHGQRGQRIPPVLVAGSSAGPRIEAATVVFRTSPASALPDSEESLGATGHRRQHDVVDLGPVPVGHGLGAVEIRSAEDETAAPPHRPVERGARGEPVAKDLPALASEPPEAAAHPARVAGATRPPRRARLSANSSRVWVWAWGSRVR